MRSSRNKEFRVLPVVCVIFAYRNRSVFADSFPCLVCFSQCCVSAVFTESVCDECNVHAPNLHVDSLNMLMHCCSAFYFLGPCTPEERVIAPLLDVTSAKRLRNHHDILAAQVS